MGIDVYMIWRGITEEEKERQFTGYGVVHGHVGYLREAYGGDISAISLLWKDTNWDRPIHLKVKTLEKRMPEVIRAIKKRYAGDEDREITQLVIKSFKDFIKLYKEKENAGLHPGVKISY